MKPRFFFWTVGLVAALALFACAPAATSAPASVPTDAPVIPATEVPTISSAPEATASAPTDVPVQAVATSRGPNLEATDPTTVNLASGQLQLVEFFRFT